MLQRLRRPAILAVTALLLTTVAACGDETVADEGTTGLAAVTISGEPGTEPEVTWEDQLTAGKVETETLVEGDGEEVAEGDKIDIHYWIGNGFTKEKALSTYDDGGKPETVTASADLSPIFKDALIGHTIGSRVAVTASAEEAFGDAGNVELRIGNKDGVLIIVDLIGMFEPPKPVDVPQARQPAIVEEDGEPIGLDFTGLPEPKPNGQLLRTIVTEGDGKVVTEDMKLKVNYLGSVYDAKKPFDESYSKKAAIFELTEVVEGWTYGLSGVKVGSRVLLTIPPDLGYGAQEQAGIPADSTLYFVIDVLAAS